MTHRFTTKKLLRYGSLTLLALVLFGYSLSRASDLLFGINLSVLGIKDGQSVTASTIAVSGNAPHAIGVTIDGHPVSIDTNGEWQDTVVLQPGYNSIKVSAADKFGRDVSNQFAVYYDAPVETLSVGKSASVAISDPVATDSGEPVAVLMAKSKVTRD